jgi:hypothetical protein
MSFIRRVIFFTIGMLYFYYTLLVTLTLMGLTSDDPKLTLIFIISIINHSIIYLILRRFRFNKDIKNILIGAVFSSIFMVISIITMKYSI